MSKFTLCPQCSAELKEDFEVCWKCNFEPSNKEQAIATNLSDLESNSCDCPRCSQPMTFADTIKIHEGTNWGILGNLGHLFTNHVALRMFVCEKCRKVEFFAE